MTSEGAEDLGPFLELLLNDFRWFCKNCLQIQERLTLRPIPLEMRPAQERLAEYLIECLAAGVPIRVVILKARRHGMSTIIQAFFFWRCATRPYQHSMTIAHDQRTTRYLHGMTERYYRYMPAVFRPKKAGATRGTMLEFKNPSKNEWELDTDPGLESSMQTTSLENAGAGMGIQWLHLSEVGRWTGEAGQDALTTALQTVPRAPDTAVFIESTAQGVGNAFHDLWLNAEDPRSEYAAFFAPWCEEPTYSMPTPDDFQRTKEEDDLNEQAERLYNITLTDEQLQWRRHTIKNECRGKLPVFHQEYPFLPEEAFLTSGRPFFDQEAVLELLEDAKNHPPLLTGELYERAGENMERLARFEPNPYGPLQIWEEPDPDEEYIIFSDCAAGESEKGDYQAAVVMPRSHLSVAAVWHGKIDRDQFAAQLERLGYIYNRALVAVEISGGWGASVVTSLRKSRYPNIYRRRRDKTKRDQSKQALYGWETTSATRAAMLDALEEVVREQEIVVNCPEICKEMLTFIYIVKKQENPGTGKAQAQSGRHDDLVISTAGAVYLSIHEPRRRKPRRNPEYHPLSTVGGY